MTDKKELIIKHQNLVYKITHYFPNYSNKEDLFQVGCIGLIKADQKYDPSFNVKFSTYAFAFILGEMRKFVREDKSLKISKDISKTCLQIEKARIILSQKLMREPSNDELCNFLDITPYEFWLAMNSINHVCSVDETITNDGKELTYHDIIPGKKEDLDSLIALRTAIEGLSEFEKKLIIDRYYKDLTQKEVAENLGISQVQVSRNENKVLTKLRKGIAC